MFSLTSPSVLASAAPRARALSRPVWKPTSTVRQMWYPKKALTTNQRVSGISLKVGVHHINGRASTTYTAQYGVSTGIADNVVVGLINNPLPSQGWWYAGNLED